MPAQIRELGIHSHLTHKFSLMGNAHKDHQPNLKKCSFTFTHGNVNKTEASDNFAEHDLDLRLKWSLSNSESVYLEIPGERNKKRGERE